ncbi:DUF1549 and DUF1553 domain-containing protein [Methylobacter tundripaludum]|uniref:DUF1553 domain-containing protein n=1 Tax=Methylobacter tundripaludum (strain ATCC BAA-1195 / DSM 17260 / SV96) TaxID=697282 RepID=G3IXK0_METTV|nr:DUF1549 and DUF1553 domain-containing protein [Methylobacter tundripaludum]EGW23409.1 protein of unknown function DUF1549 [Methylobacter tundripaludum SV96]
MKNKLYLAVMWGLTGAMAGEVGAAVDLFNSPVGVIGTQAAAAEIKAPQAAPAQAASAATDNKAAAAEASAPQAAKSKLWSYQPVKAPTQPTVNNKNWVRTPLDAFVLAPLEAKGLTPSADTDRAAFVRRATLDAWGVIPTPEDVASFVGDTAPDAYEKLADRLLASPKYGERQARRWLDLARYADSTGFQNDETRPNLWRYRDYVINAFNQDKPYSRFIQEQLAGDELWPDNQEALIATGYMANFPDNHNSRDLVQRKYQITTDITDTVGKVFLGQTVECARCHNHKFDKISQKDYFSLQAFFANLSAVDNIPAAKKGEVERKYDVTLAKWEDATKEIRGKQKAIIDTVREQAEKHHKERYLTDSREAIFKPKSQWNAQDRWVNHRLGYITDERSLAAYLRDTAESKGADKNYTKEIADKWTEYDKLSEELKKFNDLKPKSGSTEISAMTELGYPDAPPSYVFFGGDHERPLEQVQPAFPEAITDEKPDIKPTAFSSGRRTALANWIASSNNPLTARVFVNRVWEQYFGHGIVETVSDFGKAGQKPTNPELLDYLADNFIKQGWSVKKLHRDILLSSAYRQSSAYREDVSKADPDNKLLAVFPRKRLEAEQIRDSLLVASGKLEDKIGGPSVFPPVPANLGAGNQWEVSKDVHDQNRRSLYIFTRRSVPYPLLESFNMASAQEAHSKREVTTSPLQSLTLFNSDVVFGWSQALAGRVINEAGNDEAAQLDRLYQILFSRAATGSEKETLQKFLNNHEKVVREKTAEGKFAVSIPTGLKGDQKLDPIRAAAFVDLVHTVANSNEFIYRF